MRDFNSTRITIETLHEEKRQFSVLTTAYSDCLECQVRSQKKKRK
ncbi:hypothetical protein [Nostoc sp.]